MILWFMLILTNTITHDNIPSYIIMLILQSVYLHCTTRTFSWCGPWVVCISMTIWGTESLIMSNLRKCPLKMAKILPKNLRIILITIRPMYPRWRSGNSTIVNVWQRTEKRCRVYYIFILKADFSFTFSTVVILATIIIIDIDVTSIPLAWENYAEGIYYGDKIWRLL